MWLSVSANPVAMFSNRAHAPTTPHRCGRSSFAGFCFAEGS